ncbi:MAG TPA: hypothetical protein VII82_03540 [Polyangiaceae bacterium]
MPRLLAAAAALLVALRSHLPAATAAPRDDAAYFAGTWTCAGTPWRWTNLMADDAWLRIEYGDRRHPDGQAVMGWVPRLRSFVYRDFHADGSYADLTSLGLANGRWVFTGPYYPADGSAPLNGQISYVVTSPSHYDRVFEMLRDGKLVRMGGDSCTKQP